MIDSEFNNFIKCDEKQLGELIRKFQTNTRLNSLEFIDYFPKVERNYLNSYFQLIQQIKIENEAIGYEQSNLRNLFLPNNDSNSFSYYLPAYFNHSPAVWFFNFSHDYEIVNWGLWFVCVNDSELKVSLQSYLDSLSLPNVNILVSANALSLHIIISPINS